MSAMKHYSCWIILYLPIFAGLFLTLDADSEDSDCTVEIRVRRNTVYNATLGQELKINCTVIHCNNSPPTITWEKVGEMDFPVNVRSNSHIKTEWKHAKESAGFSYLIFTKILQSDAGQYKCRAGGSVSHFISVNVHDNSKLTTATWTTVAAETEIPDDTFWPFVYRVVGTMVSVTIVILICVTSKQGCKGKRRNTTKPSEECPHHVYDNDV